MGLDQDWLVKDVDATEAETFHYHRKVPALEKFFADKWYSINGYDEDFNRQIYEVKMTDLDELENACIYKTLDDEASGFFWGSHTDKDYDDILMAVFKARKFLEDGKQVAYTSWW